MEPIKWIEIHKIFPDTPRNPLDVRGKWGAGGYAGHVGEVAEVAPLAAIAESSLLAKARLFQSCPSRA